MIYFDNAATTLHKPAGVAEAVSAALTTLGNAGRGGHGVTLNAARTVYRTREKLARLFHAEDSARIAFAMNATDALNTALFGLLRPGDHVITTASSHNSMLRPLYLLEQQGVELTILPMDAIGNVAPDAWMQAVRGNTKVIAVAHASNLSGNLTDLAPIRVLRQQKKDILLVVDAAQTAGTYPIDVQAEDIDVLCFTGHKGLLGPQGTGGLYVRTGVTVQPRRVGGSGIHSFDKAHPAEMPEALEAGTLNVHGIAGLGAALDEIERVGVPAIRAREMELARRFYRGICDLPQVHFYGDPAPAHRVAIVSFNLGEIDSAEVADSLWEDAAIAVRAGAHCAPLMHEAFGTKEQGAVRFSFCYANTEDEVDRAVVAVRALAEE